jgi:RNA polymerase sigma-70 factor (sigma-E family)
MRSRRDQDTAFADFVRAERGRLVATGRLLTAGDVHLAEDLVQTALTRLYLAWGKVRTDRSAYARKVLVNSFIDHRRRPFVRRESSTDEPPDSAAAHPVDDSLDPALVAALAELPPRMRAVVVLRHVHDLSVDEVARLLGCSTGNVKSQTARGLDKLRATLTPATTPGENS